MAKDAKTPEKLNPLAEKAKERQERILEPVNAETRFSPDPDRNIGQLAEKAFPGNKEEQERYSEKIKTSLKAHLNEGVTIESLWTYLKEQYCQTTAIIEGILRFFAGTRGEKEISLAKFLRPLEIEADSNLHKTLNEERDKQINTTRSALTDLMAEIKAQNPTLPQKIA